MPDSRQSTVVDSTLRELFFRNRKTEEAHQPTMLVLLFYHMNELERELQDLSKFHEHNIRVQICPDEQILNYYDVRDLARLTRIDDWITAQDAEKERERVDHFYIPHLPFSTVSDVLYFNDARPAIRLLLWALMRGKQVSACSRGADPYHPVWQESGLHHGSRLLKSEMKKRLQQLRGFGIQLVENEEELFRGFLKTNETKSNQVITAEAMMEFIKAGRSNLEVTEQAIITPLARDIAREHNLEIREKGEMIGWKWES